MRQSARTSRSSYECAGTSGCGQPPEAEPESPARGKEMRREAGLENLICASRLVVK